jgi:hypothetical protein
VAGLNEIQSKGVFGAMIGDACARAGFTDLADKIAAVITPLADPHSSEQSGYLHLLQGDIALAAGQNDKAMELFQQSDKENSTALSTEAVATPINKLANSTRPSPPSRKCSASPVVRSVGSRNNAG